MDIKSEGVCQGLCWDRSVDGLGRRLVELNLVAEVKELWMKMA